MLGEAGVRTCSAGLRTVETRLNAFGQLREIKLTPVLGVRLQHLQYMRHGDLLRMGHRSYHDTGTGIRQKGSGMGAFPTFSHDQLAGPTVTNTQPGMIQFV